MTGCVLVRFLGILLLITVSGIAAGPDQIGPLPPDSIVRAVKIDAEGNMYAAGSMTPAQPRSPTDQSDAFVAKFSAGGGRRLFFMAFSGSGNESFSALAVGPAGAVFLTGNTTSSDFPVAPNAAQATFRASSYQGILAKVDSQGAVIYATYFGNTSNTVGNDIAVTRQGEAVFTGQSVDPGFDSTPGAAISDSATNTYFVAKLNAAGSAVLFVNRGIGGGKVVVDPAGNIVVAGATYGNQDPPITPGAFQNKHDLRVCGGTAFVGIACFYQHVAKFNPAGSQLLFSTFVTGSYGASPTGLALDSASNIVVAGTTRSPDYPVTPGSLLDAYLATNPVLPLSPGPHPPVVAPAATGYVTKLKADGTGIVFSTFVSGSRSDTISGMELAADGIYLTGTANSPDFPGLLGVPTPCLPQAYVTRLTLDGTAVTHAGIAASAVVAVDPAGIAYVAQGATLLRVDLRAPIRPIACMANAADLVTTRTVAPGQLVAIFGNRLADYTATGTPTRDGILPSTLGNLRVRFNGIAAPLLYVSQTQVNVAVPYEIKPGTALMEITTGDDQVKDSRELEVVPRNPSAFLRAYTPAPCNGSFSTTELTGQAPLALNEDGTINGCEQSAPPGSIVTLFLNGAGMISPAPVTGAISAEATPLAVTMSLDLLGGGNLEIVGVTADPGSVSSVARVHFRVPATGGFFAVPFTLSVEGVRAPGPALLVWVKAGER